MAHAATIAEFFHHSVAARRDEPALGHIRSGELHWRTWREVADDACRLSTAIRAAGVQSGDCVAQVSENRYEWIVTDLALHLAGAVHVPIHVTLSGEQIATQISDCGAKLVFTSHAALAAKFAPLLPSDVRLQTYEPASEPPGLSRRSFTAGINPAARMTATPNDLATILYTSGTTGGPRGVMLSHRNLASNAAAIAETFGDVPEQVRLNILPLSHIYARTCDLYTWVYRGSRLVLAESRDTLERDCALARPTALNGVPYLYQRIADKIREGGANEPSAALRSYFGGRMKWLTCGGAPLAPEVETWYAEQGLPILCGYGLTESAPVISMSTPDGQRCGSVGRVLPGVEVRIAEDGEILARGPNIMLGYWHDDVATAEAVRDGWLRTGDLGECDADGFLRIRGRKKELIVLSTGKKVSPTRVENLLTSSPLIDQAAVFGDGQSALVALIVPTARGIAPDICAQEITRCLASAAREEQVGRFAILERAFSIDRGELTPKLSLCRTAIARSFAAEIGALHANRFGVAADAKPAPALPTPDT